MCNTHPPTQTHAHTYANAYRSTHPCACRLIHTQHTPTSATAYTHINSNTYTYTCPRICPWIHEDARLHIHVCAPTQAHPCTLTGHPRGLNNMSACFCYRESTGGAEVALRKKSKQIVTYPLGAKAPWLIKGWRGAPRRVPQNWHSLQCMPPAAPPWTVAWMKGG